MKTYPQVIYGESGPAMVVLPVSEFQDLVRDRQDLLSDEALAILAVIEGDGQPTIPYDGFKRVLEGENPLKVYREHANLTQEELADRVGVSAGYISQCERFTRHLGRKLRGRIATVLKVAPEELEWNDTDARPQAAE